MASAPATGAVAHTPGRSPRQANGTPSSASSSRRQRAPNAKNHGNPPSAAVPPHASAHPPPPAATDANVHVATTTNPATSATRRSADWRGGLSARGGHNTPPPGV